MSDSRLEIVPCMYKDAGCASFVCNNGVGYDKYYVGNPYSGGLHTYDIFCSECVKHLALHIPSDLLPDSAELEQRLRAELIVEYNGMLAQKLADATQEIRMEAEKFIAYKLADVEAPLITVEPEVAEDDKTDEKAVFRCLDCGDDFSSQAELNEHKKEHDEKTPANKRSKKPETAARKR